MEGQGCIYCRSDTYYEKYTVCYGCSEAMGELPEGAMRIIDAFLERIEALEAKLKGAGEIRND